MGGGGGAQSGSGSDGGEGGEGPRFISPGFHTHYTISLPVGSSVSTLSAAFNSAATTGPAATGLAGLEGEVLASLAETVSTIAANQEMLTKAVSGMSAKLDDLTKDVKMVLFGSSGAAGRAAVLPPTAPLCRRRCGCRRIQQQQRGRGRSSLPRNTCCGGWEQTRLGLYCRLGGFSVPGAEQAGMKLE